MANPTPDPMLGYTPRIKNAWDWLSGNAKELGPVDLVDIGLGLVPRGLQALGRGVMGVSKGVAMAATDAAQALKASPDYGFGVVPPTLFRSPKNLADLKAEAALKRQAAKEASMAHLQQAFDSGEATATPEGKIQFADPAKAQAFHLKIAQEFASRFQPEAPAPDPARQVGAVFDTLTGGNPVSGDYVGAYTTGKPDLNPDAAEDESGWVRPQTKLGAAADQVIPLAWNILAGKTFLDAGAAGSGLEGLGKLGGFQAAQTYPQSYAAARSNPEVTPESAHNFAMTHAAFAGLFPMLGVTRVGSGPLARGLEKSLGWNPAVTTAAANQAVTLGEAAVQTGIEGRANQYLDPSASGFDGGGFLKNLAMLEGMGGLQGSYRDLKGKTAEAAPPMQKTDTEFSIGDTPAQVEKAFMALQGRQLGEKVTLMDWLKGIQQRHGLVGDQLQQFMDTARVQAEGGRVAMPEGVDVPAMQKVMADPEFQAVHKRLYDLHSETQTAKGIEPAPYDPNYVPRVLMMSPHVDLPNGPNTGGGIAKTGAGVNKERTYMALQDVAGGRQVVADHGQRAFAFDPETQGVAKTFKKSTVGIEAHPIIQRMIRSMRDMTGFRDQEMDQELTRMEAELNVRADDYLKHQENVSAIDNKLQDLQQQHGDISAQLKDLVTSKPPENFTAADNRLGTRLHKQQKELAEKINAATKEMKLSEAQLEDVDGAADNYHRAVATLEQKMLRMRKDKLEPVQNMIANDPRAEKAHQTWNEAAGELSQMRRSMGAEDGKWASKPVFKELAPPHYPKDISGEEPIPVDVKSPTRSWEYPRTDEEGPVSEAPPRAPKQHWVEVLHRMTQATTDEIEGQMPQNQYRKDAFLNLAEGGAEAFGAHGGTMLLDQLRTNPNFAVEKNGQNAIPMGWEEPSQAVLSRAPMLKGHAFEPRINALLESMAKGKSNDGFLKGLGDLYMDLGFANPTVHWHNMIAHFIKTGGADLFTPSGASRMAKNMERARIALETPNEDTRAFLAGGGTLMTRKSIKQAWDQQFAGQEDIATRNQMGTENHLGEVDAPGLSRVNRPDMSDVGGSLSEAVKQHGLLRGLIQMPISSMNKNMTWKVDDQLRMALAFDRAERANVDLPTAIGKVDEMYPSYKNPLFRTEGNTSKTMLANKVMHEVTDSPLLNFMRYRMGAWGSLAHSVSHPIENASNLAAMGGTMALGAAVASPILKTLTNDDQSEYRGGGPTHILSQVEKLMQTGDWLSFVRGQGILRPEVQIGAQVLDRSIRPGGKSDLWGMEHADVGDKLDAAGNIVKSTAKNLIAPVMWGQDVLEGAQGRKDLLKSAALQLMGGTRGKTAMESRLSLQQGASLPPDDTSLEGDARLQSKREAAQLLQMGDAQSLIKMLSEGRLKDEDFQKMIPESIDSRTEKLSSRLEKFTMDKAQPIFNSATPEEFNAALPMMLQKAGDATNNGKHLAQVIAFYKHLKERLAKGEVGSNFTIDPKDIDEAIQGIRAMKKQKDLGPDTPVVEESKQEAP